MAQTTSTSDARALWRPEASAKCNGDFIIIETYSSYRMSLADPEAPEHILAPDASNETLGQAVLAALRHSRFLSIEEDKALYSNFEQRCVEWVKEKMDRFGYKTKNALFRKMKHCDIQCKDGLIILEPSHHAKLALWTGDFINKDEYVKIPESSSPAEVGAALRLAFSRCTGMGAD